MTAKQLKHIAPYITEENLKIFVPLLNESLWKYGIDLPERLCCFISQVAHESGSFNYTEEIASGEAYENRVDLGNTQPGDGIRFKGRGLIQVTGRSNYAECSKWLFNDIRLLESPVLLSQPKYAVLSAIWYWVKKNLNYYADKPNTWTKEWRGRPYFKFEYITILINGGLNGLKDRYGFYQRAKQFQIEFLKEYLAIMNELADELKQELELIGDTKQDSDLSLSSPSKGK